MSHTEHSVEYPFPSEQVSPDIVCNHYLSTVQQLTGAMGVSLLVESIVTDPGELLLVHQGALEPIPELATKQAASASLVRYAHRARVGDAGQQSLSSQDSHVVGFISAEGPTTTSGHSVISVFPSNASSRSRESRESRESSGSRGFLVRILVRESGRKGDEQLISPAGIERRESGEDASDEEFEPAVWLELRFGHERSSVDLSQLQDPSAGAPSTPMDWLAHTLIVGANLAWKAGELWRLQRDPTSKLPGRAEFQASINITSDDRFRCCTFTVTLIFSTAGS